ncbi:MAG: hypothetical protein HQK98_09940 [Nitrospirae bacterium]|nr:hypothetical protein [Nitrospirota bacterium]
MNDDSTFIGFLMNHNFTVTLGQIIMFFIANSLCLLMGRFRLGLLLSYTFIFYWGFIYNREYLLGILGGTEWGLMLYMFCGVVILFTFLVASFSRE